MPYGRFSSPPWSRSQSRLPWRGSQRGWAWCISRASAICTSARSRAWAASRSSPRSSSLRSSSCPPGGTRGIIAGAIAITLVGAIDDVRPGGLNPALKLAGQLAAAAIPVFSEVRVENMTLPFIEPIDLGNWGYPLTLVGIVAVINVVNFTDGADGLAAGVCTIAAATFAIIALSLDRDAAGILAALTAGAAIGFLWHNFHPASIFMGDAGSNLLGLLLACVAIQGVLKTAAVVALFFPLVILAVPALDATFVVAKRIKYGRPVTTPRTAGMPAKSKGEKQT